MYYILTKTNTRSKEVCLLVTMADDILTIDNRLYVTILSVYIFEMNKS